MPDERPICVTGASGFVASHIVATLLAEGRRVRGTVRSLAKPEKYGYLTGLPGAAERLELVEAELLSEGSYDAAVAGCGAVIHAASPYVVDVADPQRDLVDPALLGTRNVLRSCARAEGLERVVVTSSVAAVTDEPRDDHVFTEEDWNEQSSLTRNPYYYSKTLAERAAWEFLEQEQPGFSLVVVNPFVVLGPALNPGLNTSNKIVADMLSGVYPGVMNISWGVVDVRDVARAHLLALTTPAASGRYLCAHEVLPMGRLVELLRELGYDEGFKLPRLDLACKLGDFAVRLLSYTQPAGTGSFLRSHVGRSFRFDNGKIRRELGLEFRPLADTLRDTVEDLLRWGHLQRR